MADEMKLILAQAKMIGRLELQVEDLQKQREEKEQRINELEKQREDTGERMKELEKHGEQREKRIKELEKQREYSEKRVEELGKQREETEQQMEDMKATIETLHEVLEQALAEGREGAAEEESRWAVALVRPYLSCVPGLVGASTATAAVGASASLPPPDAGAMGACPHIHATASSPADANSVSKSTTIVPPMTQEEVEDKSEELLEAVVSVREQDVHRLLMQGANASYRNANGLSALHAAAQKNHVDILSALVVAGALVDAANGNGTTALHSAAMNGNKEALCALLNAGAAVDPRDNRNYTPLHFAAYFGQAECAKALLSAGSDVNAVNDDGDTVLHAAADNSTVRVLLNEGTDMTLRKKFGEAAKDLMERYRVL